MKTLIQVQFLPVSIKEAWDFFSLPQNLNRITPEEMNFDIISDLPEKMYEGMLINYRLKPMSNIVINWTTEISHIKENEYFIDEERIGPYKFWQHEHHFAETVNGVIMTDILNYDIGKSILGWIAGKIFVEKKVKEIFHYRYKKIDAMFGNSNREHILTK